MTGRSGWSRLTGMDKPDIPVSDPPAAFARFKQALQHILSVSKGELKQREDLWKKERKQKQKVSNARSH